MMRRDSREGGSQSVGDGARRVRLSLGWGKVLMDAVEVEMDSEEDEAVEGFVGDTGLWDVGEMDKEGTREGAEDVDEVPSIAGAWVVRGPLGQRDAWRLRFDCTLKRRPHSSHS